MCCKLHRRWKANTAGNFSFVFDGEQLKINQEYALSNITNADKPIGLFLNNKITTSYEDLNLFISLIISHPTAF